MRLSWIFCSLLVACSSHDVHCDAHLQPINQPAHASPLLPAQAQAPTPTPTKTPLPADATSRRSSP